jgi:putative endonuclease
MLLTNAQLGRLGEDIAAAHLARRGYTLIDRNWRVRTAEIDIVARSGGTVVFCEVKTRRSTSHGLPAEAVTSDKLERMRRAALTWLGAHRVPHTGMRLDVIAILFDAAGGHRLTHLEGVGQ